MAGQVFYKRKSDGAIVPINPGPKGDKGDTGPQGPKGDPGEDFTPTDADARYVNTDGDTMTGPLIVPAPAAVQQVPRLARTPDPTTGDLGLPGFAGSDTGWRNLGSLVANGWVVSEQVFRARRCGATVYVVAGLNKSSATSDLFTNSFPEGFMPSAVTYQLSRTNVVNTPVRTQINIPTGVGVAVRGDFGAGATTVYLNMTYVTDDTWPTSLPGTAVTPPASWS